jgi:RecA/RadA recombinase
VMFGNPETTTGGNALKFYASLDIRRSTQIKDGDTYLKQNQSVVKTKSLHHLKLLNLTSCMVKEFQNRRN